MGRGREAARRAADRVDAEGLLRASLLALLAAGELDVLLGTHALLGEGVGFRSLGLVVIDEQHRFGVAQRAKLRDKGDGQGAPHLLVMTATPIPRTLALTAYGDLDTSILDELPPGREPVATRVVRGARGRGRRRTSWSASASRSGERAYVVCPKVEGETTWKRQRKTGRTSTTAHAESVRGQAAGGCASASSTAGSTRPAATR